jgi:hypothetical protein
MGAGWAHLVRGGALSILFSVRGTASDPKFVPDAQKAAGGLLEPGLGHGPKRGKPKQATFLAIRREMSSRKNIGIGTILMISEMIRELRRAAIAVILLVCAAAALGQSNTYLQLQPKAIEDRLKQFAGSNRDRELTLKSMFQEAGCSNSRLKEQAVAKSNAPNLSCTLAGTGGDVIVVGAHFDYVPAGEGVVDNWSGASLLPSLYQSLSQKPRRHTFVFVSFTDEEKGFVGSRSYVAELGEGETKHIKAMIDIDTLGLGPTEIWVSNSDPGLVEDLFAYASEEKLRVKTMNVDGFGNSDGQSFKARHIPIITLHSVTNETLRILHTKRDNLSAMRLGDYYDSYRLIAGYLAMLDSALK